MHRWIVLYSCHVYQIVRVELNLVKPFKRPATPQWSTNTQNLIARNEIILLNASDVSESLISLKCVYKPIKVYNSTREHAAINGHETVPVTNADEVRIFSIRNSNAICDFGVNNINISCVVGQIFGCQPRTKSLNFSLCGLIHKTKSS